MTSNPLSDRPPETARRRPAGSAAAAIQAARAAAAAAERAGDPAAALSALGAGLAAAPGHAGLLSDRARLLLGVGRTAEAAADFETILANDPFNPRALAGLAQAARRAGDTAAAIRRLEAALASGPPDVRIPLELARLLLSAGRPEAAAEAFAAARRIAPADVRPLLGLAQVERERGEAETALALLAEAAERAPQDAAPLAARAALLADLGRIEEAREACRAALAMRPDDARLQLVAGRLARQAGDPPAAVAHLRKAAAGGRAADALPELGRVLLEAGEVEEALALCEAVPATAMIALARAARAAGRQDAAARLLERALAAAPGDRAVLFAATSEWTALGRPEDALRHLEKVLVHAPRDAELWLRLGLARRAARGSADGQALAAFLQAANADPEARVPLREACREHLARGDAAAAAALLRRALGLGAGDPDTLRIAVSLLHATGDSAAALRLAERVRAAAPEAWWADDMAVSLLAEAGRWGAAHSVLDAREARDGPSPAVAARRLRLLEKRGDPAAAGVLAAARAAWPADPELWWQEVAFRLRHGPFPLAAAALAAPPAFAAAAPARLARLRAQLAEAEWQTEEAAALYAEALRLGPGDAATLEDCARVLLLLNQPEAALRHLRERARAAAAAQRLRGRVARARASVLGRLAEEYLLEPDLLAALRDAQPLPAAERVRPLLAIARGAPEHTAPALSLLLALRQAGLLDTAPPSGGTASPIPRRIVQFWDQPDPPPDVRDLMESWPALNPGFAYRRHDGASALAWLLTHHPPEVVSAFRRADHPARKADIFRLAVLATEGGIYADADDRCVAPLDELLRPGARFVGYQVIHGAIGNNFLAVAPGHPVIVAALHEAVEATNRGDRGDLWLVTGPGMLSRRFAAHLTAAAAPPEAALDGFAILQAVELRATVAIYCAAAYRATPLHWQMTRRGPRRPVLDDETRALLGLAEREAEPPEGRGRD